MSTSEPYNNLYIQEGVRFWAYWSSPRRGNSSLGQGGWDFYFIKISTFVLARGKNGWSFDEAVIFCSSEGCNIGSFGEAQLKLSDLGVDRGCDFRYYN